MNFEMTTFWITGRIEMTERYLKGIGQQRDVLQLIWQNMLHRPSGAEEES
jgi:hypothetical protein